MGDILLLPMDTIDRPTPLPELRKLGELIETLKVAMLTTALPDGKLRARPMATLEFNVEGAIAWFFTAVDAPKVDEISEDHDVGLTYLDAARHAYLSISGRARIVRDRDKARSLWTPAAQVWFPGGVDDPKLALLKVEVRSAEYWDGPSSDVRPLYGEATAAETKKTVAESEHAKLEVRP